MNDLIIAKVSAALKGHWANPDLVRSSTTVLKLNHFNERNVVSVIKQQIYWIKYRSFKFAVKFSILK